MFQLRNTHKLKSSASNVIKQYSALAQPLTDPIDVEAGHGRVSDGQLKVTTLANGVKLASVDTGGSISRLSISVQSGSRVESASNLGITHLARNAAFSSSASRTALRVTREMQNVGGGFESTHSRELLSRDCSFMRSKLQDVLENITADMTSPASREWEFPDVLARSRLENGAHAADEVTGNLETAHKLAFRTGLGNSLFCSNLNLKGFSHESLNAFATEAYVGNKISVVATDCDHDELVRYAQELLSDLPAGAAPSSPAAAYLGGETHLQTSTGMAHVSLVGAGASLFSSDLAAFSVLQHMLGTSGFLKWGSNTVTARLNVAAQGVTNGNPLLINCINASYSDAGLFGFYAIAGPADIAGVMKAAVGQIQAIAAGEVETDELARAKNQATSGIVMAAESKADVLNDLAKQIIYTGSYSNIGASVSNVVDVTAADVAKAAAQVLSKLTLVATGNTAASPYIDQIV